MEDIGQYKLKVEKELVNKSLDEYEAGRLSDADLKNIANYVVESMKNIKNKMDMLNFLKATSVMWPFFASVSAMEEGSYKELVEDDVYKGVMALADSGKIDKAIELSKTVTN